MCLSYVENYFSTKGCTQWDIGKKKLIFDVCVCPMLRIISPQKAAHNEILVKRQQFNFQCVCLSYVENYVSTKGCTQWDIDKKTTI